jgi:hypothetical protein
MMQRVAGTGDLAPESDIIILYEYKPKIIRF